MIIKQPILIIDDDEAIREFVTMALENEGYDVVVSADGETALQLAMQHQPFLILLDMFMPTMDGISFVNAFRQLSGEVKQDIPIVMLTAANPQHDLPETLAINGVLEKPFNLDDLIALVERYADMPLTGHA